MESSPRAERAHALGDGGPGVVGAAGLRRRALRHARHRQVARPPAATLTRRGRGLPRLRRVGGHAELEQRQGRGDGRVVLRHERVARRRAAAAAPRGDRTVGGRGRPVPRREPPRRHLLERLHARLGRPHAPVPDRRRRSRSRAASPGDDDRAVRAQPSGPRRHPGAAALRRQLGRRGTAPARQRRGLSRRRLRAQVPPAARRATTSVRSTRSRAASCSTASSSSSCAASIPASRASRRSGWPSAATATRYRWRYENEWPLARTQWTEHHLDAAGPGLSTTRAARGGARRATTPSRARARSERPVRDRAARAGGRGHGPDQAQALGLVDERRRRSVRDRAQPAAPTAREVIFPGPQPAARARSPWRTAGCALSHRKLDPVRSTPYRPYHTHDEIQKVRPGEAVPVEIEILPTSAVFERGHRLVLEVGAQDDARTLLPARRSARPRSQRGTVTIHTGGRFDSHLLLPIIPAPRSGR